MYLVRSLSAVLIFAYTIVLAGCGEAEPVAPERYVASDALITQVKRNVEAASGLVAVADIDHSRLAHDAGSPMPPARVFIFSDPNLESQLIKLNPLVALDFPLRILAYENETGQSSELIYNSFDYLVSRYQLDYSETLSLRNEYSKSMSAATSGIPASAYAKFEDDTMQPAGIITIDSPFDFEETIKIVNEAIDSQDDAVHFGVVNFSADASEVGVDLPPAYMVLFGGPGPGGKAMSSARTLGLDAFCQKFLIWQDVDGHTHLSFNDLLALADRQQVKKALALRVINYRLGNLFSGALEE